MKLKVTTVAALLAAVTLPAYAQTTAPVTPERTAPGMTPGLTGTAPMGAETRGTDRSAEKDSLEQALKAGTSRNDYAKIIEKAGYRISSINSDKNEYLEYEVVKGDHSYEVQLDFDDGAMKATKIDVTNNMWRADATKRMEEDPNYKPDSPLVADKDSRHSDRKYMKGWTDEKEKLEKSLATSLKADEYRGKIESMGYKVTSVNDKEKDYVEYEIVKGDNSYEVQIDIDPKTRMGKKVDVTTNAWEADSTEQTKGEKK